MSSILLKLITCLNHLLAFLLIIGVNSCKENSSKNITSNTTENNLKKSQIVSFKSPKRNEVYVCGDTIEIELSFKRNIVIDSIRFYANNDYVNTKTSGFKITSWISENAKVGQNTLKTVVFYNDSLKENNVIPVILLSDIIPKVYTYNVVNKYPHDANAFTQGLVYDNGFLFESTGRKGKSSLRKVNIETGIPVKKLDLDPQLFGEGILIFSNKIYQITYKAQIGFIYDKNTLDLIRRFDYQINEGWGLTTDGNKIFMSDGSSNIYLIDFEYFTQLGRIEVFNHKGIVANLNELEYINGKIFANILGDTKIVIIDPNTGKITGEMDLKSIVPEGFQGDMDRVLNGIAFNNENNHLFITGKYWPVLYEIEINDI